MSLSNVATAKPLSLQTLCAVLRSQVTMNTIPNGGSIVPLLERGLNHRVLAAQTFAEKLFARLQKANERLETRLAMMGVCSRAIGVHRLLLLNFYPFLQKYIQPHQLDVTRILAILVQVRSDAS